MLATVKERRDNYRQNVRAMFGATADLYYACWGEFFHIAIFRAGEDEGDFDAALERTHERYFAAVDGANARRILELACGGGAFSAWMAERTRGEVVGIDISVTQLAHARRRLSKGSHQNLRFLEHDIMCIAGLDEPPFDAAVCLDAACYLPDKGAALGGVAARLIPGARLLLVDWCRAERVTALQEEMILEPFYRYWGIPEMETVRNYERAFEGAGFRLIEREDLSTRVAPNWERGYEAANRVLAEPSSPAQLLTIAANAVKYGTRAVRLAKEQFYAAVFAKVAADAGLLRYVYFLGEKSWRRRTHTVTGGIRMRVSGRIRRMVVLGIIVAASASCAPPHDPTSPRAATNATPRITSTATQAEPEFEAFTRGASPPEVTVEARAGSGRVEFSGVMKDADMVSVAQYRIARKESAGWKLAARWMDLILAGGQWDEPSGRYTGASMQHMKVEPGVYRIIVRAEDSNGAVTQAVSNEVEIR